LANSATLSPSDPSGIRPALRLGSAAFLLLLVALAAFPHSSAAQVVERPQLRDIETDRELMMYRVYHTITSEGELVAEQYKMAATLFRNVIAQFPNSYEAHANLGYAQLMDYMDQFEPADIAAFDIGHLVVGAFTRRPESMEPEVRGINAQLWFQATSSLQAALRLNPGLAEAKANLELPISFSPRAVRIRQKPAGYWQRRSPPRSTMPIWIREPKQPSSSMQVLLNWPKDCSRNHSIT
jgi:hypothetical protein